uniref:ATP synthase complex subunit 8 n=1 Tax=Ophionereis sp. TaxID=3135531 RepID=A0AAU6PX68_9ECHI
MPQLDFTLWLTNLILNWTLLLTIILMLNNYYSLNPNINSATTNLNINKNSSWNWN